MGRRPGGSVASAGSESGRFTSGAGDCGKADMVQFALLETAPAAVAIPDSALELVLRNGERLRIAKGVEAATLRLVLDVVRR